jgi:ABC-type Mn2+/Zn2+ transport system permease subunit
MALVGDALGHVALPGMGLALILGVDTLLGALAMLTLGVLLIWRASSGTRLPLETLIGILFVTCLAIGFLIIPEAHLLHTLVGDISNVTAWSGSLAAAISALGALLVRSIYRGLMLTNISEDLAAVEGISVSRCQLLFLISIGLIVSVGIKVTGSLLVGALVIIPPATSKLISMDLRHYVQNSVIIGVISNICGVAFANLWGLPPGPMIIVSATVGFASIRVWTGIRKRYSTRMT